MGKDLCLQVKIHLYTVFQNTMLLNETNYGELKLKQKNFNHFNNLTKHSPAESKHYVDLVFYLKQKFESRLKDF